MTEHALLDIKKLTDKWFRFFPFHFNALDKKYRYLNETIIIICLQHQREISLSTKITMKCQNHIIFIDVGCSVPVK